MSKTIEEAKNINSLIDSTLSDGALLFDTDNLRMVLKSSSQLITKLVAELEARDWVSVDDRLPDERGDYLVRLSDCRYEGHDLHVSYFYAGQFKFIATGKALRTVTHWKPLDQPPSQSKEGS